MSKKDNGSIYVSNEIGTLKRLLVHSPDGGIGKIIPSKFTEWLYDDTVHLIKMQKEYNDYIKLLLYFLDPDKIAHIKKYEKNGNCFKPGHKYFYNSDKVIEVQKLLEKLLDNKIVKSKLVAAVAALEGCTFEMQCNLDELNSADLAKTLITGIYIHKKTKKEEYIFPPVPNLVFTRDIGIILKDHILLSKLSKPARRRESLIMKYVSYYLFFKNDFSKIIEVNNPEDYFLEDEKIQNEKLVSIEGGDVMMISEKHLIVGVSERSTSNAANEIIHKVFSNEKLGIEKISIVSIPPERSHMHIDTIFTQVSKAHWVMYGYFSDKLRLLEQTKRKDFSQQISQTEKTSVATIYQYHKSSKTKYQPNGQGIKSTILEGGLEALLFQISTVDFKVPAKDVKIVYSGNNLFPYDEREQWTDSCNVVALKEGVVIGYDRNEKTMQAFEEVLGYKTIHVKDLLKQFDSGLNPQSLEKTLIVLSSHELSRARGGSHCMSMPLLRERI